METDVEEDNPVRSGKRFKECANNLVFNGTIAGCVLFGVCVVGLGIAKFVMGILYLDDCQLQPLLPVYLIVEFCMALTLFLVIVVCVYKREKDEKSRKTEEFSFVRLLICMVSVLIPLFLLIWFIIGTIWVVNVREEINAPGHCKYTNASSPATNSFPSVTNRNETSTSAAIAPCSSCDGTFVDFTFGVVIAQWAIVGALFAAAIGALLVFGLILLVCARV
ncbi:hypothetical protein BsWGS_08781 [Bradybaena similaris]